MLGEFAEFWIEHGEVLTRRMPYHEVAPQLVLMAYLQRVVNGGGCIDREYGVGRGRIDLLVRWPKSFPTKSGPSGVPGCAPRPRREAAAILGVLQGRRNAGIGVQNGAPRRGGFCGEAPDNTADGKRAWQREALELKVWADGKPDPLAKGLAQVVGYLDRLSLDTGVLVVFDRRPAEEDPRDDRSCRPPTCSVSWPKTAFFALRALLHVRLSRAASDRATRLRADRGLKTPDALHLAAAIDVGCDERWTNDLRLRGATDEVRIVGIRWGRGRTRRPPAPSDCIRDTPPR